MRLLPSSRNEDWWTDEQTAGDWLCEGEVITLGRARYANLKYHKGKFVSSNNHIITPKDRSCVSGRYLFHFIQQNAKKFYIDTSTYPKLDTDTFNNFLIPLPVLARQQEIVDVLDKFVNLTASLTASLTAEKELRQKQYEYYRDRLLSFEQL